MLFERLEMLMKCVHAKVVSLARAYVCHYSLNSGWVCLRELLISERVRETTRQEMEKRMKQDEMNTGMRESVRVNELTNVTQQVSMREQSE